MDISLGNLRLDVYWHDSQADEVQTHTLLTQIQALLKHVIVQGDLLMAKVEDLQADLDKLKADVSARLDALAATIADLKQQIAAGTPVTQEQLDALDAEVKAIDDSVSPPAPPAAGPAKK